MPIKSINQRQEYAVNKAVREWKQQIDSNFTFNMCCSLRGYPSSKRPNVNTLIALGFWLACELTHAEETNVAKTEAETKQSATQLPCHWTVVHVTCNLVVFTHLSVLVWKTAQIPHVASPRITMSSAPKCFLFLWLRPIEPLHVASHVLRFAVRGTVAVFHVSNGS